MSDAQLTRIPFSQYLTDDGLPSGSFMMTGDYSGAVKKFWAAPIPGVVWRVHGIAIVIRDLGQYQPTLYGALPTLANGISLDVEVDPSGGGGNIATVSASVVKQNVDWQLFAPKYQVSLGLGNNNTVLARFDLDSREPIRLNGDLDHALVLTLNDDFTGLDGHRAIVAGFIEDVLL